MSYEGYEQLLCKNGHYSQCDAHETTDWSENGPFHNLELVRCNECGEAIIWSNSVDETNGDGEGIVNLGRFRIKEAKIETCNLGHYHQVAPAIYRIPTEEEMKAMREEEL